MGLVYDPRGLPGVMTARPRVREVLHIDGSVLLSFSYPGFALMLFCMCVSLSLSA
jgi:hypothetical protein